MDTDLHHRSGFADNEDTEVPLTDEEVYGAEVENNGHVISPPKVLVDPGRFRYNRRLSVVALPVFLLMLSMVGER